MAGVLVDILCVVGAMDPGAMVNAGPYVALVDMNKCQSAKGGSNPASGSVTNYANAVVDVTRASNSDPMIGKVWLTFTQEGGEADVFAYLSATQSPAAARVVPGVRHPRLECRRRWRSRRGGVGRLLGRSGRLVWTR